MELPAPPEDLILEPGVRAMDCNVTCCTYEPGGIICFAEYNFSDYYNITDVPQGEMIVRWSYTTFVFITGLIGNLVVIHILLSNRLLLQTTVNIFILNMSLADLILVICGPIPFTIRDTQSFWVLGEAWCHLEGFIQGRWRGLVPLGRLHSRLVRGLVPLGRFHSRSVARPGATWTASFKVSGEAWCHLDGFIQGQWLGLVQLVRLHSRSVARPGAIYTASFNVSGEVWCHLDGFI